MNTRVLYVGGWLLAVVVATTVGFAAVDVVTADVAPVGASRASVATDDAEPVVTASSRRDSRSRDRETDGGSAGQERPGNDSGRGGSSGDDDEVDGGGDDDDSADRPRRTQVSDGGTVSARCTGAEDARLLSWSPRTGWSVHSADPGPSATAEVSFTDGNDVVTVQASCLALLPVFSVDVVPVAPTGEPDPTDDSPTPGASATA